MIPSLKDLLSGDKPAHPPRLLEAGTEWDVLVRESRGLDLGVGSVGGEKILIPGARPGELVRVEALNRSRLGWRMGRLKTRLGGKERGSPQASWDARQVLRAGIKPSEFQRLGRSAGEEGLFVLRAQAPEPQASIKVSCRGKNWFPHDPGSCTCCGAEDLRLLEDWFRLAREFDPFAPTQRRAEILGSRSTGERLLRVTLDGHDGWSARAARILRGQHPGLAGVLTLDGRLVDGKASLVHKQSGCLSDLTSSEILGECGPALSRALKSAFPHSGRPVLVWSDGFEPGLLPLAKKVGFVYWAGLSLEQGKRVLENALRNGIHGLRVVVPAGSGPLTLASVLQADIPWAGCVLISSKGFEGLPAEISGRSWRRMVLAGPWDARLPGQVRKLRTGPSDKARFWVGAGTVGDLGAACLAAPRALRQERVRALAFGGGALAAGLALGFLIQMGPERDESPATAPAAPAAPELTLASDRLLRYDYLDVEAQAPDGGRPESAELEVTYEGRKVASIADLDPWTLTDAGAGHFRGRWPLPFNPALGDYKVRVIFRGPQGRVQAGPLRDFRVEGRPVAPSRPGLTAMTVEMLNSEFLANLPGPDGQTPGPANVAAWAKYIGCDMVWQCAGVTSSWRTAKNRAPWEAALVRSVASVGPALEEAGLEQGAWIQSFAVLGGVPDLGIYQVAYRYEGLTDTVIPTRHISYRDEGRLQEIAGLIRRLDALPTLDAIGLDYVRLGFGGYELVDEFMSDMEITKPQGWESWGQPAKMKWLASHVEVEKDKPTLMRWHWWRARKTALTVKHILEMASPHKPVWAFTLGWRQGLEHGQDPMMLIDAGLSFGAVMLYEADRPSFESMKRDWLAYLSRGAPPMLAGQIVDWDLVQRTENPTGPIEMRNRLLEPLDLWWPVDPGLGFFWHDLTRALGGRTGPYGAKEWVAAGASAFTKLREKDGLSPVTGRWSDPPAAPGSFSIMNTGALPLFDVKVRRLDLAGLDREFLDGLDLGRMAPGEEKQINQWAQGPEQGAGPLALAVFFKAGSPSEKERRETYLMYYQGPNPQMALLPPQLDKGGVGGYP